MSELNTWASDLIHQEYRKFDATITYLRQLKQAVDNTENASWYEWPMVKIFGTPKGGILHDKKFYSYIEYNSKIYWLPDENSTTNLHL